jgi:hypothetical protein
MRRGWRIDGKRVSWGATSFLGRLVLDYLKQATCQGAHQKLPFAIRAVGSGFYCSGFLVSLKAVPFVFCNNSFVELTRQAPSIAVQ